jgi:heme-degrading monooxygenase HmoA
MVKSGREADFLEYATKRSLVMFLRQPGCLGVLMLRGEQGMHATCSFWSDRNAAEALADSPSYQETVAGLVALGVLVGDATITVFDVDAGGVHGDAFLAAVGAPRSAESGGYIPTGAA